MSAPRPCPLVDVHAHLADRRLAPALDQIIAEAFRHGVTGILVNAARRSEWECVLALSKRPCLYGAVGIHPFFVEDWTDERASELAHILNTHSGVRAVGEIGLDFYGGRRDMDTQIRAFSSQIECAVRHDRAAIVHNRRSWSDFFHTLKQLDLHGLRGACHHFTGSREVARQALDSGFYLSFCGPLTYPNARRIKEAARFAPLDRILTETDTPDLPAEPVRHAQSRPHHVRWILDEIARIKGLQVHDVAEAVEENFRCLLRIPRCPALRAHTPRDG